MLKYYKEYLSDYAYADILQSFIVLGFVIFFVGTIYAVWKRPSSYYEDTANLPLEDDDPLF